MCALLSHVIKERNKVSITSAYSLVCVAWLIPKMADCGGDKRKSRQDRKRKQRQSASEGIIKKMLPNSDLPNKGNVWQTTEPMKLENKSTNK